jgi:hypothetical protein
MTSDLDLLAYIDTVSDSAQREYITKEFTKFEPGLNKVRTMIVAKTCYTSEEDELESIFSNWSSLSFRDSMSAQARSHSTYLKLAFMDKFYGSLDKGKGVFSAARNHLLADSHYILAVNGWNAELSRALSQTEDIY